MVWSSREAIFNSAPTSQRILRADLEESGYQSALTRSQNSQYGTGWLYHDSESIASTSSCDEWDGYMTIDNERIKIREVSDLLVTRYAFISGAKSEQGLPVLTFPDSHVQFSFADYRILVNYLARLQPVEDIFNGFVAIIDRRTDRWSSVKTVLSYLTPSRCLCAKTGRSATTSVGSWLQKDIGSEEISATFPARISKSKST
ncbi:hypothetical protein M513_12940 [Trichuris suis]|uniref:Uncharacterized protein n=1 Tax=Trichuris suis TaxID=68888 RepID=A0A085LMJ6_9BILA|nr:hypothetical protein M513_12940 [Trichuris suis]